MNKNGMIASIIKDYLLWIIFLIIAGAVVWLVIKNIA